MRIIPETGAMRASRRGAVLAAVVAVVAVVLIAGCGGGDGAATGGDPPVVVVTSGVIGDLVTRLVGDFARVDVVIPDGLDPHDFAPSAKDVESIERAVFVVSNGLGLEAGLEPALDRRAESGGSFRLTDHVELRPAGETDHADTDHADTEPGDADPHVWLDPATLVAAVQPLSIELGRALGVDLAPQAERLVAELVALDAEIETVMSGVEDCRLVTGHDSLGYFAARYGCEVIGAVVPSTSSAAEASAGELAELQELVREHEVRAVFTEIGTPPEVAEQVADAAGVPLVELATHAPPDGGGYETLIRELAARIVEALA